MHTISLSTTFFGTLPLLSNELQVHMLEPINANPLQYYRLNSILIFTNFDENIRPLKYLRDDAF